MALARFETPATFLRFLALPQLTEKVPTRAHMATRIFVVDDEAVIASTLAKILDMNGYSVRSFTEPLEALTAAQYDIPDLLISDVMMPGLSGLDLAIQVRETHPRCKVLLFSGQARTVDLLEDARHHGHNFRLLEKPVFPTLFLSEIRKVCDEPDWRPEASIEPRPLEAS
jgi:DNA-binding NtrC family response regulator